MFLVGGGIILGDLMLTTTSLTATVAPGSILLGILGTLVGVSRIGLRTREKRRRLLDDDD